MSFDVVVEIRGLDGLADPEGLAIERALPSLGFEGVRAVHVGKVFRFVVDAAERDRCSSDRRGDVRPAARQPGDRARRDPRRLRRLGGATVTTDVGIVCFPGSNCEHDVAQALGALGASTRILWHAGRPDRGRRCRRDARGLRPRRLPATRRDRPLRPGHGGGRRLRRPGAARSSGSATASRCSPRRVCSRAR